MLVFVVKLLVSLFLTEWMLRIFLRKISIEKFMGGENVVITISKYLLCVVLPTIIFFNLLSIVF